MKGASRSEMVTASLFLMAAPTAAASAATVDRAWFGRWTLDRSSSVLKGDPIEIGAAPHGYRFDFGAVRFFIGDDGQFYPTVPGRETSLRRLAARSWLRVHRNRGVVVDRSLLTVSADDRVLTIATVRVDEPGRPAGAPETFERVGRGSGLAGDWRGTRLGPNVADMITLGDAGGGKVNWGSPADGNYYVVALDGPPAANRGPTSVPGVTLILKRSSAARLRWIESIDGKPYAVGSDVLAQGGRTLTETSWPARTSTERQVAVYRR